MLILTRKPGESIAIGNNIKVTILSIAGKQVKVGIAAPDNIPVFRDEIYKKIQSENVRSSLTLKEDLQELTRIIKERKNRYGRDKS